jgi:hypothetical protein
VGKEKCCGDDTGDVSLVSFKRGADLSIAAACRASAQGNPFLAPCRRPFQAPWWVIRIIRFPCSGVQVA